jgi:hypothetical protein
LKFAGPRTHPRIPAIAIVSIWGVLQALTAVSAQIRVPLQPFAQQVRQVETTLGYLGQPLSQSDQDAINQAIAKTDENTAIAQQLEQALDKYALAIVDINRESRVKVHLGPAKPELVEGGSRIFLVKVINKAEVTARLETESPNALSVYVQSDSSAEPSMKVSSTDVRDRWMGLELYDKNPMSERLSGLPLEYRILEVYSRDSGQRSAKISSSVGQGTQDIGFRNEMEALFDALPASALQLRVRSRAVRPRSPPSPFAIPWAAFIQIRRSGWRRTSFSSRRSIVPIVKRFCYPKVLIL